MVPSTLPAAEPSILARGKIGNLSCANRGVFAPRSPGSGDQIPSPAVSPKNALRNSHRKKHETTSFIVFSRILGPFFRECPKNTKKPSCRECYYPMSFSRGLFLYKFPFFFSNFKLARFAHSDLRTVLKPLFL